MITGRDSEAIHDSAAQRDKLVLADGREPREFVPHRPNLILAEWLGLRGHDHPAAGFATARRSDLS